MIEGIHSVFNNLTEVFIFASKSMEEPFQIYLLTPWSRVFLEKLENLT